MILLIPLWFSLKDDLNMCLADKVAKLVKLTFEESNCMTDTSIKFNKV